MYAHVDMLAHMPCGQSNTTWDPDGDNYYMYDIFQEKERKGASSAGRFLACIANSAGVGDKSVSVIINE